MCNIYALILSFSAGTHGIRRYRSIFSDENFEPMEIILRVSILWLRSANRYGNLLLSLRMDDIVCDIAEKRWC